MGRSVLQGSCQPMPVLVATDIGQIVVTSLFHEEKLPLSFRGLMHFDPHPEWNDAVPFTMGN